MISKEDALGIELSVTVKCHFCSEQFELVTERHSNISLYDRLAERLNRDGWDLLHVKNSDIGLLCCSSCLEGS